LRVRFLSFGLLHRFIIVVLPELVFWFASASRFKIRDDRQPGSRLRSCCHRSNVCTVLIRTANVSDQNNWLL
jgi:hypothetical protein